MLKSLALVVVLLAGGATAADGIQEQDQIYIVAGVLGGVCLLLTIATIFTTLAITKLQTQVAVLQAGSSRPAPIDNRFNPTHYYDNMGYEMSGPAPPPRPYRGPAAARDNYY